jgi:hypothetical protein
LYHKKISETKKHYGFQQIKEHSYEEYSWQFHCSECSYMRLWALWNKSMGLRHKRIFCVPSNWIQGIFKKENKNVLDVTAIFFIFYQRMVFIVSLQSLEGVSYTIYHNWESIEELTVFGFLQKAKILIENSGGSRHWCLHILVAYFRTQRQKSVNFPYFTAVRFKFEGFFSVAMFIFPITQ